MHINIPSEPLTCSKCGSQDIWHPSNKSDVICRCAHCGHEKKVPHPADRSAFEKLLTGSGTTTFPKKTPNTF